ncbi:MAG: hypothetical protein ABFS45_03930 [Pseudomonadota bacterium]
MCYALVANVSVPVFWVFREAFQEALYFRLDLKAPARVAFEGFLDDRGQRFVTDQDFSLTGGAFIAIAPRCLKDPITVHQARLHPIKRLFGVLLPLMLRDTGQQIFYQDGVGILAKLNGRRFQRGPSGRNCAPELQVRLDASGQPRDVINDDHARITAMLA